MTVNTPDDPRWTQPEDQAPRPPVSPEVAPALLPYPATPVGAPQLGAVYGGQVPYAGQPVPYVGQPTRYPGANAYGGPTAYPGRLSDQPNSYPAAPYAGQPGPAPYPGQSGPMPYATRPGPVAYNGQPGPIPYAIQRGSFPYTGMPGPVLYPAQLPVVWHGPPIAEIWRRLVARLIDSMVWGAVTVGLAFALGDRFGTLYPTGTVTSPGYFYNVNGGGMLVILGLTLINEVLLVATLGGQVGKLAMGLRVARLRDAKIPAGPGWLVGRWFLLAASFAFCFIPGVVMALSPLWGGPLLQGWHDKAFQTVVVRKTPARA